MCVTKPGESAASLSYVPLVSRPLSFSGFTAWLAWVFIHLIFLVGFRNRLVVLIQWFYSYANYKRGARIINGIDRFLEMDRPPGP